METVLHVLLHGSVACALRAANANLCDLGVGDQTERAVRQHKSGLLLHRLRLGCIDMLCLNPEDGTTPLVFGGEWPQRRINETAVHIESGRGHAQRANAVEWLLYVVVLHLKRLSPTRRAAVQFPHDS